MENKEQKQPTKKEIEGARAKVREIALKNLKASHLSNLATAYFTQLKDSGYGENANSAVEEFLYFPALNSGAKYYNPKTGEESDLMRDSLLGSRKDGERYSGQVSEYDIIKTSADIIKQSLGGIKVEDIMPLIGSSVAVKDAYKNKYIGELAQSENKEYKELVGQLVGGYIGYVTNQGVSKALSQRSNQIKSGLESLVKAEKK